MYLSRLILDPRSRQVRNELVGPYEMHRTVNKAFPDANFKDNEASGILFRVDVHPRTYIPTLLVQSRQKPDWDFLSVDRKNYLLGENDLPLDIENPAIKEMNLQFLEGQILSFRLKANPTFKKTTVQENGEKHKARLGIFEEDDQRKWLANKLNLAGAVLVSVSILDRQIMHGKLFTEPQKEKRIPFLSVQFDGVLQVQKPDELVKTIYAGIGTSKGFGFGLLSLARAQ